MGAAAGGMVGWGRGIVDRVISCRVMLEFGRRGDSEALSVTVLAAMMMEMSAGKLKGRKEERKTSMTA